MGYVEFIGSDGIVCGSGDRGSIRFGDDHGDEWIGQCDRDSYGESGPEFFRPHFHQAEAGSSLGGVVSAGGDRAPSRFSREAPVRRARRSNIPRPLKEPFAPRGLLAVRGFGFYAPASCSWCLSLSLVPPRTRRAGPPASRCRRPSRASGSPCPRRQPVSRTFDRFTEWKPTRSRITCSTSTRVRPVTGAFRCR